MFIKKSAMQQTTVLAAGSSILFLGVIAVNTLANALPINGMTTGEISNLYPSLFTPAGVTFSVWSLIYLSLFAFVIYQWRLRDEPYYEILSKSFVVSCVLNAAWILAWHHVFPFISVLIMLGLLAVLIKIFVIVHREQHHSKLSYWLAVFPFTLYLSWICVATIANIAAWLTSLNIIESFGTQVAFTVAMMLAASALAVVIIRRFDDYGFPLVTIWALAGIAIKGVAVITPVAIVIAAGLTFYSVVRVVLMKRFS
jgi:translocator protein